MELTQQILAESKIQELNSQISKSEYLLSKWELVNKCDTSEELAQIILNFADSNGNIQGRSRVFNAKEMSRNVELVIKHDYRSTLLTREFGIRQQAVYLKNN
jgi:hypothetical protein